MLDTKLYQNNNLGGPLFNSPKQLRSSPKDLNMIKMAIDKLHRVADFQLEAAPIICVPPNQGITNQRRINDEGTDIQSCKTLSAGVSTSIIPPDKS